MSHHFEALTFVGICRGIIIPVLLRRALNVVPNWVCASQKDDTAIILGGCWCRSFDIPIHTTISACVEGKPKVTPPFGGEWL